jgi:hypothetical protein
MVRPMHRMLLAAAVVSLLTARPAAAQPIADELPPGPWYGWQLIASDAAAAALLFVPVSERVAPLARGMGMITLLMDGPIVHMAHGNSRGASFSLARLPLLLLGRLLGSLAGDVVCSQTDCVHAAPVIGSAVGIAPVIVYDWLSARRPGRLFYATRPPPRLPLPRLQGWALTVPVFGGRF